MITRPGRINHLGKTSAERLAEKTDGKSASQAESGGDDHYCQKGVKASRGNEENDDKSRKTSASTNGMPDIDI